MFTKHFVETVLKIYNIPNANPIGNPHHQLFMCEQACFDLKTLSATHVTDEASKFAVGTIIKTSFE